MPRPASWSPYRATVRGLAVLALALGTVLVPSTTTARADAPAAVDSVAAGEVTEPGIIVLGVSGLYWSDVDRTGTPTLWRMVSEGSVGSVSVRGPVPQTCPTDAWLTFSAGQRTLGSPSTTSDDSSVPDDDPGAATSDTDPGQAPALASMGCQPLPEVLPGSDALDPVPADIPGWAAIVAPTSEQTGSYGTPGTVGTRLAEVGVCATAVGPGAALALSDTTGHVSRYLASPGVLGAAALTACPVTVVDLGQPADDPSERQTDLDRLDALLAGLVDELPEGWRVVLAGVSDTPVDERGLQVVVDWRVSERTAGWLTSESTRRPGIVTLADLSATVLATVGGSIDSLDGSPLVVDADRRMSTQRTVENRRYLTELTTTVPHLLPVVIGVVGLGVLGALGTVLLGSRRGATGAATRIGPGTRRLVTAMLLIAACTPVGAFLAALSRWWGSSAPTVMATAWTALAITGVALAAWLVSRVLPAGPWRLGGVTAGITWLVLTVDGVTGTILQQGSILGATPTLGARYYGFGNLAFAVYAASALVLAGALAAAAQRRRRPVPAVTSVIVVGLVTVIVDGWPGFGADFGGVLALVPAFALLVLSVAGAAVTPRRVGITVVVTAATVALVAGVDWLRPGASSHLGTFVQRVIDGDAWAVVASKATGAWASVANPVGALAAVACLVACMALVGPARLQPAALRGLYLRWPLLRAVVTAVVLTAGLGTVLNDSGIAVASAVLAAGGTLVAASWAAHTWSVRSLRPDLDQTPLRRMPGVIVATGGGLLATLLLAGAAVPGPLVAPGDVPRGIGLPLVAPGEQIVVIGTTGIGWQDVSRAHTPTLWAMLRDGAAAGGVTPAATGVHRRCASSGWLALSAGRAPLTGQTIDGEWTCTPWGIEPTLSGGGASVSGWETLADQQVRSVFRPRLGTLAAALQAPGICATAIGPGAGLALADTSGTVARYRSLESALNHPDDAFACEVTLVDAGSAALMPIDGLVEATASAGGAPRATDQGLSDQRVEALRTIDDTIRRVLREVPDSVVLVVDLGDSTAVRPSLGVGLVDAEEMGSLRFLTTASTRWEGVVRVLDVPTTILAAVGVPDPPDLTGSPLASGGRRHSDAATTVAVLAELTVRDHALRGVAGTITTTSMLVALGLLAAAVALGRPGRPGRIRTVRTVGQHRLRRLIDGALLVLASIPAGLYLMTTWSWWRSDSPTVGMLAALAAATLSVVGLGALAPWRPAWAGPAVVASITTVVLTLDALLGTPLHRGSPIGPAPTLGGRYYGFGNPTYSIYVVATMFTAAALATWLLHRGRRTAAVLAAAGICGAALIVDLWPTLGADVGGGLVLVPASAVVVLAVARTRLTVTRLVLIGLGGLLLVGGIGLLDWMRPAPERSHLGRFVQSMIDGTAWETVERKAGYAAATVTSGPTAWLTLLLVVALGLVLWRRGPLRAAWFDRVETDWPLVRPLLLAMMLAAVGGAVVNDYGVRVATIMLFAGVPLVGMLVVRTIPGDGDGDGDGDGVADGAVPDGAVAVRSPGAGTPDPKPDPVDRSQR